MTTREKAIRWPWLLDVIAGMSDDQHARWRAASERIRAEREAQRGRPLEAKKRGAELVACDRAAAVEVIGEPEWVRAALAMESA
jgi:hypothetical protein